METMLDFVKRHVLEALKPNSISIDATCGNGHDTLFLAQRCQHVYAFDIQEKALNNTKEHLMMHRYHNVELIKDSHHVMHHYVNKPVDAIMFNLGYLPHGCRDYHTQANTTILAIKQGLKLLNTEGVMSIVVYRGHEHGVIESNAVSTLIKGLSKKHFYCIRYERINDLISPYTIIIKKIGDC